MREDRGRGGVGSPDVDRSRNFDRNRDSQWDRSRDNDRQYESYRRGDGHDRNGVRNDRYGNDRHRNDRYGNDRYGNDRYRNDGHRNDRYGSHHGGYRRPYYANGRISKMHRYGSGWRVWVAGAPYPFFVPEVYYRRHGLRVGLSISLGGYYNPLGYYDYYDGAYGRSSYSASVLRGVVESVDYRRDTFVVRNEVSGSFVTVVLRDRREDVRPGDYVELYGDWSRSGFFQAFDVDRLDYGRRY